MPERFSFPHRAALSLLFLATTWNCGGNDETSNSASMGGTGGDEATANAGGADGKGARGSSGTPGTAGVYPAGVIAMNRCFRPNIIMQTCG